MRAGMMLTRSSNRAAAQPNRRYRADRLPIIASRVLMARYASTPGTPANATHIKGATVASAVFSATDSHAARVNPGPSSTAGSRPHSDGSSARAPSTSSWATRSAMAAPVLPSVVPPSVTQVAAAVSNTSAPPPTRRCASTPAPTIEPTRTAVWITPDPRSSR